MKRLKRGVMLVAMSVALILFMPFAARSVEMPSVIVNEEEWYKDAVSPMIERGGKYYIPAEVFTMFQGITITNASEDNLLITNSENGLYISILFMSRAAAINGEVVENIDVFRDSGVYYVDAEQTADALGVGYEYYAGEGGVTLRLYDSGRIFTLEELAEEYSEYSESPEDETEGISVTEPMTQSGGRIYVFCSTPENSGSYFPAKDNLDYYGVGYTMLLREEDSDERILSCAVDGEYALMLPEYVRHESDEETADEIAAGLDSANDRIELLTGRRVRMTVTTGDEALDALLLERGYYALRFDYEINGASYADGVLGEIKSELDSGGAGVSLYLDDCWSSERMAILLSEESGYSARNLFVSY